MIMLILMGIFFVVFAGLMYMRWRTYQKMIQSALVDREDEALKHNFAGLDFDQNELNPQGKQSSNPR